MNNLITFLIYFSYKIYEYIIHLLDKTIEITLVLLINFIDRKNLVKSHYSPPFKKKLFNIKQINKIILVCLRI